LWSIVVRPQQGSELRRLPFKVLGGPQPRVPNPGVACAVRVKSMPGSKPLQPLNSFEHCFGIIGHGLLELICSQTRWAASLPGTPLGAGVRRRTLTDWDRGPVAAALDY